MTEREKEREREEEEERERMRDTKGIDNYTGIERARERGRNRRRQERYTQRQGEAVSEIAIQTPTHSGVTND